VGSIIILLVGVYLNVAIVMYVMGKLKSRVKILGKWHERLNEMFVLGFLLKTLYLAYLKIAMSSFWAVS
jgi:hypothetical protein